MIWCEGKGCGRWMHGRCVGYPSEADQPASFSCPLCADGVRVNDGVIKNVPPAYVSTLLEQIASTGADFGKVAATCKRVGGDGQARTAARVFARLVRRWILRPLRTVGAPVRPITLKEQLLAMATFARLRAGQQENADLKPMGRELSDILLRARRITNALTAKASKKGKRKSAKEASKAGSKKKKAKA
jgi:hypothetical protein